MRQTETYKLNLLDGADRISLKPLNENMETVERELKSGLEKAADALDKAVGSGGYNDRIAFGSYDGKGGYGASNKVILNLDFKPMVVHVIDLGPASGFGYTYAPVPMAYPASRVPMTRRNPNESGFNQDGSLVLSWGEKSVAWYAAVPATHDDPSAAQMNASGRTYNWVAIGYTEPKQEVEGNG